MTLTWMTAGESHGPSLVGIIHGFPSGLEISRDGIDLELARRQQGIGRSDRQSIENDKVEIISGIRHGLTIGSPVGLLVRNRDHENWRDVMSVDPVEGNTAGENALPRPGHADIAGMLKWGLDDARNVIERASGRSTAMTVALGALCRQYLAFFGTYIGYRIVAYGSEWLADEDQVPPTRVDIGDDPSVITKWSDLSDTHRAAILEIVKDAKGKGETLGGIVQVVAAHVPPGLGSPALPETRLDSRIAGAIAGVPGVKAVEIGAGIDQSYMTGKEAHDTFARSEIPTFEPWYGRSSNLAGGIEGGMTNGEPVCVTVWLKPLATVNPPYMSLDVEKKVAVMPDVSERSDVSVVEPSAVVLEAVVALELARVHREKFTGDTMSDIHASMERYLTITDPRP